MDDHMMIGEDVKTARTGADEEHLFKFHLCANLLNYLVASKKRRTVDDL